MKRLIITEEERERILSLHSAYLNEQDAPALAQTPGQMRQGIRQDARQQIQNLNQAARDTRQAERQANQQARQDTRQAKQDERQAQRELARTQRQAERAAKKQLRVDARNRKEMENQLADFQNMVKLYGNSETFKPYLQQYNTAIAELQKQLATPVPTPAAPSTGTADTANTPPTTP